MAVIIPALPYNLVNNTVADANQVMADFNTILTGVNGNAAHSGPNSDITSLTGLTTPLSVPQGGTGQTALGTIGQILTSNAGSSVWQTGVVGITDGSSAPAGMVGEVLTNTASGVSIPAAGTIVNVTSVSLTAGDWDVWGVVQLAGSGSFSPANPNFQTSISVVSATMGSLPANINLQSTSCANMALTAPTRVTNISGPTTVYLVAGANSTGGPPTASGTIVARRRR